MKTLSRIVAQALGAGAASMVLFNSAFAQTSPPPASTETLDRIVITGSNIPRAEKETPSPVQVITAAEIKGSGYTTVSEVLRDLTANGQGTLSQSFAGAFAGGASGVALRGLTVGATLVLIDGHRMVPYPLSDDGERPFVDISSIPFDAVERIEVLKDGASAVYGSDAIAGVVNVILKKSFTGTSIVAEAGTTQHGGGNTSHVAITHGFGSASDDNNGFLSVEYRHQQAVWLTQRQGDWTNMDWTGYPGGQNLTPGARNAASSQPRVLYPYLTNGGASTVASNFIFLDPNCNYTAMRASQCTYTNTWAQLQPNTSNANIIGRWNSRINADWEFNITGSLFDSRSEQYRNPVNIPQGPGAGVLALGPGQTPAQVNVGMQWYIPSYYPGNTFGPGAQVTARGFVQSPRHSSYDTLSTRIVAELNGSLAGWDLRSAAGYTRAQTDERYEGFPNFINLLNALTTTDAGQRYNLYGPNSTQVLSNVFPVALGRATDELDFFEVRGAHEMFKMDGGPASIGLGVGYISKNLNQPDPAAAQNGTQPLSPAYAVGKDNNANAYAEVVLPVLKQLEIDGAVRYDKYNTYGNSTTPKVGFKWSPMKELTFRATYSEGFRAPAPTENGDAKALFGFNMIVDPLLCPNPSVATDPRNATAFCNLNATYLQSTNKNLQPEKSNSSTAGMILEPVKGWETTLDYYQIEVKNQIIPAASLVTFDPIANLVRGVPCLTQFGDGSTHITSVGCPNYISSPFVNGQKTQTSGYDLETRYKFNLGEYGKLMVRAQYSHTLKWDLTIDGVKYQLAGTHGPNIIGGDTGNPRDRAQFALNWEQGPFSVSTTTNYISGYDVTDPSSGAPDCNSGINNISFQFGGGPVPSQFCKVKSFTYTNLYAQYQMDKQWNFHLSVSNLFDAKPPLDLATYGNDGTANNSSNGTGIPINPSLHMIGAIGRSYTFGVNYRF